MVAQEFRWEECGWNAERSVVFDETEWRPVWNIGPEVEIESSGGWTARDWLGEEVLPCGDMLFRGGGVSVVETSCFCFLRGFVGWLSFWGEELALLFGHRPIPPEVPFSDAGGAVALLLGEGTDGYAVWGDEGGTEDANDAGLEAGSPVVATGEKGVAGRGAHAG